MTKELQEAINNAVAYMKRHGDGTSITEAEDLVAAGLRDAHGTVALPSGEYGAKLPLSEPQDSIAQTRQFMQAAGQLTPDKPTQPSPEVLKLRLSLELEELYEKAQAFGLEGTFCRIFLDKYTRRESGTDCNDNPYSRTTFNRDTNIYNAVEVLDAAADQRVVADGTILACGLASVFPAAMEEVRRSNMSKFPSTEKDAIDTVAAYHHKGIDARYRPGNSDYFIVYREGDSKILKALDYSPANLAPLLNQ